jgi:hypothetical protein
VWTKELKVGDQVGVKFSKFGKTRYRVEKVKHTTPTGRIRLNSERIFYPNGKEVGRSDWYTEILPLTPELKGLIAQQGAVEYINSFDLSKLNLQELRKILEIMKGAEESDNT